MAKEAGAKKVYFSSAAPPVKFQNLYGIDMAATNELIASGKTDEEVADAIGADWLIYQDLKDLIDSARRVILLLKILRYLFLMVNTQHPLALIILKILR